MSAKPDCSGITGQADRPLRVLHLSTDDAGSGAFKGATRLHHALRRAGCDSHMLVGCQSVDDPTIHCTTRRGVVSRMARHAHAWVDALPRRFFYSHLKNTAGWSGWWCPWPIHHAINTLAPDVVHLHWVGGFVSAQEIPRIGRPLVWTMHDMGEFTGGCRFTADCVRFQSRCGCCPQLKSSRENDLSRRTLEKKIRLWSNVSITPVGTSAWMAGLARQSAVFGHRDIRRIPISVPINVFRPMPMSEARSRLGLREDATVLVFGSAHLQDPRKGFHLLRDALRVCAGSFARPVQLLIFGSHVAKALEGLPVPVRALGYLRSEEDLRVAYAAADAYVLPSVLDNLPSTVLEALACGTPPIVCGGGGAMDAVRNGIVGFLAPRPTVEDVTSALLRLAALNDVSRLAMRTACRHLAETEYAEPLQVERYWALYRELAGSR